MSRSGGGSRSPEGGFTLLEIMIALAILAVGAVCVLSTFAAAIALHLRRENDVRAAQVVEEARASAQAAWDAHVPTKGKPFPADAAPEPWSRDAAVSWSYAFRAVPGQPLGLDGTPQGVMAVIRIDTDGRPGAPRIREVVLTRRGFIEESLRRSWTHEEEKKIDRMKAYDPGERRSR